MNFNIKLNKKELTFLGIGILMLIIVAMTVFLSIRFLIGNANKSFNKQASDSLDSILQFQIERAEKIEK